MKKPQKIKPASHRLRSGRHSQAGQTYHIRFSTHGSKPLFVELQTCRAMVMQLKSAEARQLASTLAYVVMPDHVHWLCTLGELEPLHIVVAGIKARTSSILQNLHGLPPPIWQRGYFDRALRREEGVDIVAQYIIANPLRRNLVQDLAHYPHWDTAWL